MRANSLGWSIKPMVFLKSNIGEVNLKAYEFSASSATIITWICLVVFLIGRKPS
jgi:hypothetical protein